MLNKLCFDFNKFQPVYVYQRYAFKKRVVGSVIFDKHISHEYISIQIHNDVITHKYDISSECLTFHSMCIVVVST